MLSDCEISEVATFCKGLSTATNQEWFTNVKLANGKRTGIKSEIVRYMRYFSFAFSIVLHRRTYGVIVGWQQFFALIFCFFCSVLHLKKENIVIAVNFTYKEKRGLIGKIYKKFMLLCVNPKYLDFIHIPSQKAAKDACSFFNFPMERIIVSCFGVDDLYGRYRNIDCPELLKNERYALAIGRSNRDYGFLIKAWEKINCKLVIISDTCSLLSNNPNVIIIKDVTGDAQYPYIRHCAALILPILDGDIPSGDTVLLTSMSFKKKVVVTVPSTLGEMYIKNEENGLLVAKRDESFVALMQKILFTPYYDYLEDAARKAFLKDFSRESLGANIGGYLRDAGNVFQY